MRQLPLNLLALATFGVLCACSGAEEEESPLDLRDPLIEQALGDHLMVDRDLASQNEANAALTVGYDSSIPPLLTGPDQRSAARSAARNVLVEGGAIVDLPAPEMDEDWPVLAGSLSAAELASRIDFAKECADRLNYSAIWAARLPAYAAIVPRGAVVEAAGNPQGNCNIRIITYLTDLPVEEVLHFHYNQAKRAKLSVLYSKGAESAIHALSPKAGLAVHARKRSGFQTEVNIISREFPSGQISP